MDYDAPFSEPQPKEPSTRPRANASSTFSFSTMLPLKQLIDRLKDDADHALAKARVDGRDARIILHSHLWDNASMDKRLTLRGALLKFQQPY